MVKDTLHHLDGTSANVEQITAHADGIMADVQGKVYEQTHPSRAKKILDGAILALKTSYYLSWLFK